MMTNASQSHQIHTAKGEKACDSNYDEMKWCKKPLVLFIPPDKHKA